MPRRFLLGLALLLPACVSPALLSSNHSAVKDTLAKAATLSQCAPRDRAIAEANLAFAELEMQEANSPRAAEHLTVALEHAQVAAACAPIPVGPAPRPEPEVITPIVVKPGDSDHDGVVDSDDQCPQDMEDLDGFKDGDGCPDLDNDNDGVPDTVDACPVQPEDRDGYNDGDGCPELDNDGDGIADTQDQCPNERGTPERNGCPVYDRDSDGINDDKDLCADQPETLNAYMDEDGCPDVKPTRVEVTANQIVIKQRINFATGKTTILADSFAVLDDVAQVMKDYPNITIEIAGHTDNVGDDNANQRLSKARADAVFEYLVRRGIAASRMQTVGYGETRPIDTNRTDEGRQNNRRVEFNILSGGPTPPPVPVMAPATPSPWGQ